MTGGGSARAILTEGFLRKTAGCAYRMARKILASRVSDPIVQKWIRIPQASRNLAPPDKAFLTYIFLREVKESPNRQPGCHRVVPLDGLKDFVMIVHADVEFVSQLYLFQKYLGKGF